MAVTDDCKKLSLPLQLGQQKYQHQPSLHRPRLLNIWNHNIFSAGRSIVPNETSNSTVQTTPLGLVDKESTHNLRMTNHSKHFCLASQGVVVLKKDYLARVRCFWTRECYCLEVGLDMGSLSQLDHVELFEQPRRRKDLLIHQWNRQGGLHLGLADDELIFSKNWIASSWIEIINSLNGEGWKDASIFKVGVSELSDCPERSQTVSTVALAVHTANCCVAALWPLWLFTLFTWDSMLRSTNLKIFKTIKVEPTQPMKLLFYPMDMER
jgi:hypothetical protein